ncbi:hypothetical protein BD311DRAFT_868313 [Dichomitus squalens]|uniref:Ribonuclease H1 N-terminal domain-containing protein n=1 Tax=Dichomitus squalens TaxID=114155 RepID=A0A4Q9MC97_9APHY|nr:hypothetical protein BD311DRAFT_868313 [Dichomitus squalens]
MPNGTQDETALYEGPYVVVLGSRGDAPRILNERPPNTALGKFPSLLPIVVVVKNHDDAVQVDAICALLEAQSFDKTDYGALKSFIQHSREIAEALTRYEKIYAIRVGHETGIWAGISWDHIEHFKEFKDAKWKGHPSFRDALLWMIEKAPYNWVAKLYSPPQSPTKKTSPSTSQPISSQPISSQPISSQPISSQPISSQPISSQPISSQPISSITPPRQMSESPSKGNQRVNNEEENIVRLMDQQSLGGPIHPALQALQAVIRPLPSQIPSVSRLSGFRLGTSADAFLRGRLAHDADIFKVLRARLYAASPEVFAHYVTYELGWSEADGLELWDMIELPGL